MTVLYKVMKSVSSQSLVKKLALLTPLEKRVLMSTASSSSLDHLSLLVGSALILTCQKTIGSLNHSTTSQYIDSSQTSALIFLSQLAGIQLDIKLRHLKPSGTSLASDVTRSLDDLVRLGLLEKKMLPHPQFPDYFPRIARTYYQATEMLKEVYPYLVKELPPAKQVQALVPPLFVQVGENLGPFALAVYLTHLSELQQSVRDASNPWRIKFRQELDTDVLKQQGLQVALPQLIQYYELYLDLVRHLAP